MRNLDDRSDEFKDGYLFGYSDCITDMIVTKYNLEKVFKNLTKR